MEEDMRDAGRRPVGRLCYWMAGMVAVCVMQIGASGTAVPPQGGPPTTTVTDTVYDATGNPANGTMIITWPAFSTAAGAQVAEGSTNAAITSGAFSVALVANAGATPTGVYYTVVFQLGPGDVRVQYWVVPTTTPANLAAVVTTPGSGTAGQPVSLQYVNSELATKANDNAVVHLAGTETITGTKSFSAAPTVPTPTSSGQIANKGYVDSAVSTVGSGNFLSTAGGTMTGPIVLPANPTAPLQAAPKEYVDTGLSGKADLISGLVPTNELGTGLATAGNCLLGNGTWGPCTAGGTGNLSTNPITSQAIAQPVGTQFSTNNLANIRYVTASWNWAQTPADNLATPGPVTIHLSPCPLGIDTASTSNFYIYKVYISGQGTPEAVTVTGGTCTPGASSGTITVSTGNAHAAGYTVGSATAGIQEAWNDAWTSDTPTTANSAVAPYVKLVADTTYNVFASIYLRGKGGVLDGAGALIACSTRDRCIYIGTTQANPAQHYHKIYNLTGTSTLNVDGVQVAGVSATGGTYTVTTATTHPFVVGDTVDCEYHSQTADQHWASQVLSVPSSTSFTVAFRSGTFSAGANTFGFCNILNAFIEDNSDKVIVQDINLTQIFPTIGTGFFSYGIVNDNDQEFIIERAGNRSSLVLQNTGNWPIGAFVYQRGDQGNAGITYIHGSEFTSINCATASGNGFVMSDTVCQGFPLYGVRYFGGLQPATLLNVYEESTGGTTNPLYGSPAQMGFEVGGGVGSRISGTFPIVGWTPQFASGGTAATERTYFVVPRSSTMGYGPLLFAGWAQPATGTTSVTVTWPSIELEDGFFHQSLGTLTWDVLVTTGQSAVTPFGTGGYAIATNVAATCGTNGMCSFTDTQAPATTYTVQAPQFLPVFWFWPANLAINDTTLYLDEVGFDPQAVASQGATGVAIVADQCQPGGVARRRTPIWVTCTASSLSSGTVFNATVFQQSANNASPPSNSKGRLNLGPQIAAPNDEITIGDSNFNKTLAAWGERPPNDAGDLAIGVDQLGGMSQRAGTSISEYINTLPNTGGTNFLERLTASSKTLNVPLTVNGGLAVSGSVTLPVTGSGSQCLHVSSSGVLSGTGADCGSGGGTGSGTVNVGSTTQLALYAGGGAAVSGDTTLTDNGTTLNYTGAGGIASTTGLFSGNLTVNGQLLVAGPWTVSSPIPGTAIGAASAGTSSLGISNDGNFYISANAGTPQKVATTATSSFFSNLTQEDANDIGEFNGTTAQNLHVYSNFASSSSWARVSMGYDPTDNLSVLRSENSTPGSAIGLGFWIGSSVRWAIDSTSNFKPFLNNSENVGTTTLAPQTVYAATSFDTLTQGRQNFEICNDAATGTSLNFLAIYNGASPACAVKAGTSNTDGVIGVVSNGSGTTGNAVITYKGYVVCSFDGSTTAGDFVVTSTSNPGDCHDGGATRPSGVQVLGRVESTNSGVGTYGVRISLDPPLVTGAPTSSPTFTGMVTLPDGSTIGSSGISFASAVSLPSGSTAATASTSDNSTKIATTAYVQNQGFLGNTGRFLDASLQAGSTLDVKLNNANALAITSGTATIDARAMGGAQTIASQVNIGELPAPSVSAVSGTSPGAGSYKVVYTLISPTASETSASQEATVTVTSGQSIKVNSPTYYGTATAYNVYVTAAGGASWTETKCITGAAIGAPATIISTSGCSGAVSLSNRGFAVELIPPKVGTWTVTDTNGISDCGIKFFDQSSAAGGSAGEGRPLVVTDNSSTNVEALICTDNNPKLTSGFYKLVGLSAENVANDHVQSAVLLIRDFFDVSVFDDMQATVSTPIPAGWVYGNGGGGSSRLSGNFEAFGIGEPLRVGLSGSPTNDFIFNAISAVHPGPTFPNIEIQGSARSIHFAGTTYMEGTDVSAGTVSTSGTAVTGSGTSFRSDGSWNGATMIINGTAYTVSSCSSTTSCTLTSSAGTQSAVSYAMGCVDAVQMATTGIVPGAVIFDDLHHGAFCQGTTSYLYSVPSSSTIGQLTAHSTWMGNFTNLLRYAPNTALNVTGVGTQTTYPNLVLDNNNPVTVATNLQVQGTTTLGTATATTAAANTNTTQVATTAYVTGQMAPNSTAVPWITTSHNSNSTVFSSSTNKAAFFGEILTFPKTTSQVSYYVGTADTTNTSSNYDIGLYTGTSGGTCTLVAHTGAIAASTSMTAGPHTVSWTGGSVTLSPGRVYLAITSAATSNTAVLWGDSSGSTFAGGTGASSVGNVSISSGGTLPATTTCPTDGVVVAALIPMLQVN
jgi:hypothetical protein